MSEKSPSCAHYDIDAAQTTRNRARLERNPNLLYWYEKLYQDQLRDLPDTHALRILEIGSGVSPMRRFYPNVITSDILQLDYLDYIFDCHTINQVPALPDESFDIITLTNVLHHLHRPIEFLQNCAGKLKRGGRIIATEPYFSFVSTPIFKYLHHESVDLSIVKPELPPLGGPLANANIALPWLMFVKRPSWIASLRANYEFDEKRFRPFSSLSYMATGGISRRIPIPTAIYRLLFHLDLALSRALPTFSASFFTIILTRK